MGFSEPLLLHISPTWVFRHLHTPCPLLACPLLQWTVFPCRTSLLQVMVCDPYANYVVQKIIDVADQEQRATIIMEIRAHAPQLKRYTFGKHIISRLEKLSGKKM